MSRWPIGPLGKALVPMPLYFRLKKADGDPEAARHEHRGQRIAAIWGSTPLMPRSLP